MSDEDKTEGVSEEAATAEALKTIDEKLDALHALLEKVSNFTFKIDQNTVVLAGRLDAIEPEVTQIKGSLARVETVLVHVTKDMSDIRDRVFELGDDHGSRLRVLETHGRSNGRGNGHG